MRYSAPMDPIAVERNHVGSVIKAVRLLDGFSVERRVLTLQDFTTATGMNKTTVYRLLQTLVAAGMLVRAENGAYRLGAKALRLGAIARADLDLRAEALPFLQALADEFGDTAFLMIPGDLGAVTIEAIGGTSPVRIHGVSAGTVLPYHVAAGPTVIAAFHPEIADRVLASAKTRSTSRTLTDPDELAARLERVRRDGYAISAEDFIDEISAVGAPVRDDTGEVVGSLSLGGPSSHFGAGDLPRIIDRVTAAAGDLSARLGS